MRHYRVALVALVACGAAAPVVANARSPVYGMLLGILTGLLIAYHGMYWVRYRREVQAWRYLRGRNIPGYVPFMGIYMIIFGCIVASLATLETVQWLIMVLAK